MQHMLMMFVVSQEDVSWLKAVASQNMRSTSATVEASQEDAPWLKDSDPQNIFFIVSMFDESQDDTSWLKAVTRHRCRICW